MKKEKQATSAGKAHLHALIIDHKYHTVQYSFICIAHTKVLHKNTEDQNKSI